MNKKKPFFLNQSSIKNIIKNGTEILHCPWKFFVSNIARTETRPTTLAMFYGKYFESQFIGGVAHGGDMVNPEDVPRKKVTKKALALNPKAVGEKRVAQIRIEKQIEVGKEKAKQYGIVYNELNTQVVVYKRWEKDPSIILRGEFDWFPTAIKHKGVLRLAAIDLKLTADVSNDFGDFCWGDFPSMDHIQAEHYTYLVKDIDFDLNDKLNPDNNLRELFGMKIDGETTVKDMVDNNEMIFIYWVFDYKKDYSDIFKPYPIEYPHKMNTIDWAHYHETIRKAVVLIREMHRLGFPKKPNKILCKGCHVTSCEYHNLQFDE